MKGPWTKRKDTGTVVRQLIHVPQVPTTHDLGAERCGATCCFPLPCVIKVALICIRCVCIRVQHCHFKLEEELLCFEN